jgi:3-dehydroquinate dehydratase type I
MMIAYSTMSGESCIIYTSVFFDNFNTMKTEFENNLKDYPNHYEIRFDLFKDRSPESLRNALQYLNSHGIDYIFTFRSDNKEEIRNIYGIASEYRPPIVDVDVNSFVFDNNFFKNSKLMISYHGLNGDSISTKLRDISKLAPDIYKIALTYTDTAKFLSDLHFVYLYKKENMIKIAYIPMGTNNSFLRVISAYIVSDYSYASYKGPTASGQITLKQFNTIFQEFREKYE